MDKLYLIPESLIRDVMSSLAKNEKDFVLLDKLDAILHNKLLQNVFAASDNKEE